MRLVVDTNILISALLARGSLPGHLITLWRQNRFDLLTADEQLDELMRVTRYAKIRARLPAALAGRLINELRAIAVVLSAITWHPANRARHESEYPERPRFTAAEVADWSRIFKRVDAEHPKRGKNSFQALVGRQIVGADLVTRILWHTRRAMASSKSSVPGSPTHGSARSSSASPLARHVPARPAAPGDAQAARPPTLDRDALDALAWIESGMADEKVGYGPDAPRLSPEQAREFAPSSYVTRAAARKRQK